MSKTSPAGRVDYNEHSGEDNTRPKKGTQEWAEQYSGEDNTPSAPSAPQKNINTKADGGETGTAASSPVAESATPGLTGYDDQIKIIEEAAARYKQESEDERKERERKERNQRIWASVGDGIAALSNLYFTTKGAPSMYNHDKNSQQTALEARLDKAQKEREDEDAKAMGYKIKMAELHNARYKTLREIEAAQEAAKLKREAAERDAEKHGWEKERQFDVGRKDKADADAAESKAATAAKEKEYADTYYKNRAESVGRSGSSGGATPRYPVYDADGNVVGHVHTEAEAVTRTQQNGGDYPKKTRKSETQTEDVMGPSTSTTTTTSGYDAPPKRRVKKPNPMSD